MTELLERWAELEPERCWAFAESNAVGMSIGNRGHLVYFPHGIREIDYAIILVNLIKAIEARGLWWKLQRFGTNPHARAWVGRAELQYAPPTHEADTPAAALLAAYVAALEAEAGQ